MKWIDKINECNNTKVGIGFMNGWNASIDAHEQIRREVEEQTALREFLWLNHGHTGQYGDDGEMQCQACCAYHCIDYKREPISKVIETAIKARWDVNVQKMSVKESHPQTAICNNQEGQINVPQVYIPNPELPSLSVEDIANKVYETGEITFPHANQIAQAIYQAIKEMNYR